MLHIPLLGSTFSSSAFFYSCSFRTITSAVSFEITATYTFNKERSFVFVLFRLHKVKDQYKKRCLKSDSNTQPSLYERDALAVGAIEAYTISEKVIFYLYQRQNLLRVRTGQFVSCFDASVDLRAGMYTSLSLVTFI